MSRENVELVRQMYDAWEKGDFSQHPEVWDPEVRSGRVMSADTDGVGLAGEWQGLDGLVANVRLWLDAWQDLRVEATEFLDGGNTVVALTRQTGRALGSGLPLDREMADVWEIRDGRVIAVHFYWDRDIALAAAGLSA